MPDCFVLKRARPCRSLQEVSFEESQKYKEGKFIVEKQRVMKVWRWKLHGTSGEMERSVGRGADRKRTSEMPLSQPVCSHPITLSGGKLVEVLRRYIPFPKPHGTGFPSLSFNARHPRLYHPCTLVPLDRRIRVVRGFLAHVTGKATKPIPELQSPMHRWPGCRLLPRG